MLRKMPVGLLLLVLSVGLNVTLAQRVKALTNTIEALKGEHQLKIGTSLADIQGKDLAGRIQTVRYADTAVPTLVYVFIPSCGWCVRNLENLRTMSSQVAGRYRLIGLSLTEKDLAAYVREKQLAFPVYAATDEIRKSYKLGGTPQTLLVGRDGKVLKVWSGAYQAAVKKDIEDVLAVSMPGLSPAPVPSPRPQ